LGKKLFEEKEIGKKESEWSVLKEAREKKWAETHETALMSLSWPVKVCTALPVRMSHTLAVVSHAPETKTFWFGPRERLRMKASQQEEGEEKEKKGKEKRTS
jgi:hypothetical protein